MSPAMRDLTQASQFKCTIVSLVPYDIIETKPGMSPGEFKLKASRDGVPSVLTVAEGTYGIYIDGDRGRLKARTPSTEISRSFIEDYVGSQLAVDSESKPALFVVPGTLTAEEVMNEYPEELKEVQLWQRNWFIRLVKMADDSWNKYHQHGAITELMRYACEALGETRDWLVIPKPQANEIPTCPACFTTLNSPKQAICHVCGCVTNEETYNKMTFTSQKLKGMFNKPVTPATA